MPERAPAVHRRADSKLFPMLLLLVVPAKAWLMMLRRPLWLSHVLVLLVLHRSPLRHWNMWNLPVARSWLLLSVNLLLERSR